MLEEEQVRNAIHALIERKERRIGEFQSRNHEELSANERLLNEVAILELQNGINTLIELEHNLRLCGYPEEVYVVKQEG